MIIARKILVSSNRKDKKTKINRRRKFYFILILSITIMCNFHNLNLFPKAWASAEQDREAELIAGAKKEGKLVFYTTINTQTNEALRKTFVKKYPFIKMEVLRTNNVKLLDRVVNEARAGKHLWDVISFAGFHTYLLKKKNFIAKYIPPGAEAVPEKFKDPDGYWNTVYLNILITGYNTTLVSAKDIPRSYEDLLDPKWKGKMSLDSKDIEWFANMLKIKGEEEGLKFMKKLAAQDLRLVSGHSLGAQLLAAAEFHIGITLYPYRIELMKTDGAPIDWVPLDPVIAYTNSASLYAKAPHPNAAKLLINFLFSREGQGVIAKFGRITSRSDVPARFSKMRIEDKIRPSDISLAEDFNKYTKQFKKIFFKRKK